MHMFGRAAFPFAAAAVLLATVGAAPLPPLPPGGPTPVTTQLVGGAVGTVYDRCGESDLCATIDYPDGEHVAFYSEGAAWNQPYVLLVLVTTPGKGTFNYERRIERLREEQLTIDRGRELLVVDTASDGTLRFSFQPVVQH
jgi:hypothetical protein